MKYTNLLISFKVYTKSHLNIFFKMYEEEVCIQHLSSPFRIVQAEAFFKLVQTMIWSFWIIFYTTISAQSWISSLFSTSLFNSSIINIHLYIYTCYTHLSIFTIMHLYIYTLIWIYSFYVHLCILYICNFLFYTFTQFQIYP